MTHNASPAQAEGMPNLSRRALFGALPFAGLGLVIPSALAGSAPDARCTVEWDLLSPETQGRVLADYWKALSVDQKKQACVSFRAAGMDDIADALMPEWTGPGIYEFKLLDDSERGFSACPVAFLDRAPRRDSPVSGRWFRWQHYWRGKFEGRGHFLPESRIAIVSKREAFDA